MPFVSLEGIDGSGKTEQVRRLADHLRAIGRPVLQTKEPDGGHLGTEIRAILTRAGRLLAPAEQLLLVSAARYDHVRSVIAPALARGEWVISDRFCDSTYAFQVAVSDVDLWPAYAAVNEVVVGPLLPHRTIVLDLPVELARARRSGRARANEDPAEAQRDFAKIRNALVSLAARERHRCRVINGALSPEQVADAIWRELGDLL